MIFWLKTMESLPHSGATPLFSFRAVSLASAIEALKLTLSVNGSLVHGGKIQTRRHGFDFLFKDTGLVTCVRFGSVFILFMSLWLGYEIYCSLLSRVNCFSFMTLLSFTTINHRSISIRHQQNARNLSKHFFLTKAPISVLLWLIQRKRFRILLILIGSVFSSSKIRNVLFAIPYKWTSCWRVHLRRTLN